MATSAAKPASASGDLTGRRLGRYEVLTMLASGGMATVYVARAQGVAGFERLLAIKVLHPHLAHDEDFISMFLDEARLAARIRHPNVVGTLDISDTQGEGYFLVMEYVEGDHFGALLRQAARAGERLPVPVVARIVMDALSGLSAAHTLTDGSGEPLEIVHRDISPHNILVGADGVARITDFGVAKAQVRLSSTRDGQFKGKLSYMAPEQAASGQADQRSDLFSMGVVLWEALTGRRLFRGENNADVLNKILNPEVPPPSVFAPELAPFDAVTLKALAREPSERYQSADELLEAVEHAASKLGGVATSRSVGREVKRWLGEKIAAERSAIQNATDALGRSEIIPGVLPRPVEGGSQPSHPNRSLVRPIASEDSTLGAKPSTLAEAPSRSNRSTILALAAMTFLLFVAGGALAFFLLAPDDVPAPEPEPALAHPAPDEPPPEPVLQVPGPPPSIDPESGARVAENVDDTDDARAEDVRAEDAPNAIRADEASRPRRSSRIRRTTPEPSPTATPPQPPRPTEPDDDELLANPYAR